MGSSGEPFVDEDFKGDAALFLDVANPATIEDENGEMVTKITSPDKWARLGEIYAGSTVRLVAAQAPLLNIMQGEVGDWCGDPPVSWKVLTACARGSYAVGTALAMAASGALTKG